jgi:putative Mn2+ efflux pump MntP
VAKAGRARSSFVFCPGVVPHMSFLSILLLGIAMSTDAFAAAVGKGAAMRKPLWRDALRAGLIFGCIEALTPVLGWTLGQAASKYVVSFDHWIAFGLLGALGVHMIVAGLKPEAPEVAAEAPKRHGFWNLAATGLATSIDAMAVGVGLAFLDVNIVEVAVVIGLCTLTMVTLGIMLGRVLGTLAGKRAEIVGGALLIAIGSTILFEHLHGAG